MSNIEEIEDYIFELKTLRVDKDSFKIANELESLLAERKQDKKRIKELEAEILTYKLYKEFESIPKQKIRDKLAELLEELEEGED